jgi:multimeric flavodoxin WrbA
MEQLYDEIFSADAVVFGTPVFIFQITGQMKIFIDRLFALMYLKDGQPGAFRNKIKGKKAVTVYSQSQTDTGLCASSFDLNEGALSFLGFKIQERIAAGGMLDLNSAKNSQSVMDKSYAAGVELLK